MTFKSAAIAGAGLGLCSAVYFLCLELFGGNAYVAVAFAAAACVLLALKLRIPRASSVDTESAPGWLAAVLAVTLAAAVATFVLFSIKAPHGEWDAWSIWNLHARFLERGGSRWTDLFSNELVWSHPDYPLLLPGLVAEFWTLLHTESTLIPMAVAFVFTFGTVALVTGAIQQLRGTTQALTAGTLLAGTAGLIRQGADQYAELPLAFYMAGSVALLCFENVGCVLLAGAMAGFAAWTKNEGVMFAGVLLAARAIARRRDVVLLLAGAAPMLALTAFFKLHYHAPPDATYSFVPSRIVDFGRYVTIIEAFIVHGLRMGALLVPVILVLGVYAWLVRFDVAANLAAGVRTGAVAIALMLLGDFAVYLLLSNNVAWQLDTSLDRLLIQLWPAAVLVFFTSARTVDFTRAQTVQPKRTKRTHKAAAVRR